MSTSNEEISNLANILHKNGDKVLNALSKLSLNAVLLQRLNQKFDLLIENETDSEKLFQVINSNNGNSQLVNELQFLHDFVQKTIGLKLTNIANLALLNNKVDISKFKSIKYLEIKKIPIKEIIGLKNLQTQLECLVCIKCLRTIKELFASCGGDNSDESVWSELREAVLSYNYIEVVDSSIGFAPWLQVLDLSHNKISDVKAIECLPNLKYVNLSFNHLEVIPTFNKSAKKKIELLVMKNNYVEDLSGLQGLNYLIELDLSNNWVSSTDTLHPLLLISTLQWLSLTGNPISCHQNYRKSVAGYLHISASFSDFYLDKIKLSKKEKSIVGIQLSDSNLGLTTPRISYSSLKSRSSIDGNNSNESSIMPKKSGKARVVVIPNLDDGTYEEVPDDCNNSGFMTSSTEYLVVKKRIENTRSAYGIDNWLVQGSSVVQDILGLPPVLISTSTPCEELSVQAALDSVKNVVTTTAVIETQAEPEIESAEKNNIDSFVTCNEDQISNYFSAEDSAGKSAIKQEIEECEKPEPLSREASPEIEKIKDEEEVEIDENEKLYLVSKEVKTFNNEIKQEELFLIITDTELQEREPTRGKIFTKWSLSSCESCVKLKPGQLHLVFDTVRRDKKERTYFLEEKEANNLYKEIAAILERRTLSEMNQVVYKCENCSSQFSKEIKTRDSGNAMRCPFCSSKFILQLDEVPLPSCDEEKKVNGVKKNKNSDTKISHNRSSSTGGFFQSLLNQNENKILKCASQTSIENLSSKLNEMPKGSAASLDELNELPFIQNTNVKRSDSDIEILSNPSQSSIEVIEGPGNRTHNGNTPHRKRSSEERQFVPTTSVAATTSFPQGNNAHGLTESSSSGSITDSICTAYENSSTVPSSSTKQEAENLISENLHESEKNSVSVNSESILQDVLNKAKMEFNDKKSPGLVSYSYSEFADIDYRIKLFLYTHVFEDSAEEFSFGLRGDIVNSESNTNFPSVIIFSTKKLYFLKVINQEQGDDVQHFLQKVDFLKFNLSALKSIYPLVWHQGVGIKIQAGNNKWKNYIILLKDPSRTKNFLKFLSTPDAHQVEQSVITQEIFNKPYLVMQQFLLSFDSLDDSSIRFFCLIDFSSITNTTETKEIKFGALLTTCTDLLIFTSHLNWLTDNVDNVNRPPDPQYCQKFKNMVQAYSHESTLFLQFFDGIQEKEVWRIKMETVNTTNSFLKSVKKSWKKLFSVPLQHSVLEISQ